jgi:protein N-terminal methyltransferase
MANPTPDSLIKHDDAKAYWSTIDPDVNGMLGGFPYISRVDLQGSKNFLAKLGVGGRQRRDGLREQEGQEETSRKLKRAVDCGAGWAILYCPA